MAISLPHIEDSDKTIYFPPRGEYVSFVDDADYAEKVKEWGLSTTREVKRQFWYKEATHQRLVTIKGYQVYGETSEFNTIIIEFQDGNLSCVHPAYLKEMQSPSFGKVLPSDTSEKQSSPVKETPSTPIQEEANSQVPEFQDEPKEKKQKKEKKEKAPKLELPEEKVHFTATVKQFALSWNNFNEENDEVVVLENVVIQQEKVIEVGLAWCAHSKTLKKFELEPGENLEFDGKIIKKKLPKGKDVEEEFVIEDPVLYKVNNPSKIKKS